MILPNSYFISQDDERGRSVVRFSAHRLSRLPPLYLPSYTRFSVRRHAMQCDLQEAPPPLTHSLAPILQTKPSFLSFFACSLPPNFKRRSLAPQRKGESRELGTRQQYRRVVVSELNCDSRSICGFSEYFTFVEFLE